MFVLRKILGSILNREDTPHKRHVKRVRDALGRGAMIQVIENKMAAGSCAACRQLASKPQPLRKAPDGPLPECPHPDQCRLHWRATLTFDD